MRLKFLFLLILPNILLSQKDLKRDYNWLFGYGGDLTTDTTAFGGSDIRFLDDIVTIEYIDRDMFISNTNTSISDSLGNLLFYTNGCFIANADHEKIQNGDSLNFANLIFDNTCGMDRGYTIPMGATILPLPESDNRYYLFHINLEFHPLSSGSFDIIGHPVFYSIIDMNANNGDGMVIEKNNIALADTVYTEHMKAVRHANNKDWWIVVPKDKSNVHFSLLLDENGLHGPFEQAIGDAQVEGGDGSGQSVFSPDGTKYVKYDKRSQVYLYDFDRLTGELSNYQQLNLQDTINAGGVAISPNNRFLYVSNLGRLFQFDLTASDIQSSKILVGEWDGFSEGLAAVSFYLMQLGPDCRIYMNSAGGVQHMSIIHYPNRLGTACEFQQHAIELPTHNSFSMPNFPNYRLGISDYPCDSNIVLNTLVNINELDIKQDIGVGIYPNPNNGNFSLKIESDEREIFQVEIINDLGQVIQQVELEGNSFSENIKLPNIISGVYFVSIKTQKKITVKRVVIFEK